MVLESWYTFSKEIGEGFLIIENILYLLVSVLKKKRHLVIVFYSQPLISCNLKASVPVHYQICSFYPVQILSAFVSLGGSCERLIDRYRDWKFDANMIHWLVGAYRNFRVLYLLVYH